MLERAEEGVVAVGAVEPDANVAVQHAHFQKVLGLGREGFGREDGFGRGRLRGRGGGVAVVKEVKTFKGDATVVMVRGQPRHGFDFDVTLAWECTFAGDAEDVKPVKGTAHIPEASRDTVEDDEVDYTVKVEDRKTDRRSQEDAAYDALKSGLRTFLRETFATVDKELLARANGAA